jgi:hypothetical protein
VDATVESEVTKERSRVAEPSAQSPEKVVVFRCSPQVPRLQKLPVKKFPCDRTRTKKLTGFQRLRESMKSWYCKRVGPKSVKTARPLTSVYHVEIQGDISKLKRNGMSHESLTSLASSLGSIQELEDMLVSLGHGDDFNSTTVFEIVDDDNLYYSY